MKVIDWGMFAWCQLETLVVDDTGRVKRLKADIPVSTPEWRVQTPWRRMVPALQYFVSGHRGIFPNIQ
jgi:hypothetical protein